MRKAILVAALAMLLVPASAHAGGRQVQHIQTTTEQEIRTFLTCDTGQIIQTTATVEQQLTIVVDPDTNLTTLAIATREKGTAANLATGETYRFIFVDNETVHFTNGPSSHDTFVTQAQPFLLIGQGQTRDYRGQVVRHIIYTRDGVVDLVYKVEQPLCYGDD